MRVIHYLNQFFGGIGAEEQAGMGLEVRDGAVGPGKLLEQLLGDEAQVIMTLVCGDNYAVEHEAELVASVLEKVRRTGPDLFVAGPCFEAGRYGMAAGALCVAVQTQLGIPVITGMSEENPGVDLYRDALYIIDSGTNAARMRDVLGKMASLGRKLVNRNVIGLPAEEGYLQRGLLRDQVVEQTAARRLIDMLVAKVKGEPFESEMLPMSFEAVPMPSGVKDLSKAKVMLITDGGLCRRAIRTRFMAPPQRAGVLTASKAATIFVAKNTKFPMAAMTRGSCKKIRIVSCPSMPCAKWKRAALSASFTTNLFRLRAARIRFRTRAASAGKWPKRRSRRVSMPSSSPQLEARALAAALRSQPN
jgi:Glycine/sarcosine/betaine reductase selenoprotein B (GRDB)